MKTLTVILVKVGTFEIGRSEDWCCNSTPMGDA